MRIPCQCGQRTSLLPCLAAFSAPGLQEEQCGRGRRLECSEQCWALLEQEEEVRPEGPAGIPGLARRQERQAARKKKKKRGGVAGRGHPLPGSYGQV